MRVVYLSHAFMVGGAEEMVLNLVRHLPPRFEPMVACIHEAGPIGEEIRRTGVPFAVLGLTPGLSRPLDVLRLRDALQSWAPAIVHTFLLTGSLYGRFAAMMGGVPIVIGTEVNIYENKRPLHARFERWLMNGTDAVVASAESVKEHYIAQVGADPGKVEVIYNAVDWAQLQTTMTRDEWRASIDVPLDAPAAGIIARLTEQKAHRVLFESMTNPELSTLHLIVVGDGELRDDLRSRAETLGIGRRVHFLGARRDLGNILAAIDIFAMPSYWEGLPLSMVLAMGAGLPVVASRVAGIPEVVKHGDSGLLVDAGDANQLAQALATLVRDSQLRSRLGAAAKAFVLPRFGIDGYVASIASLYDRLLAAKGRGMTLGILYHMPFWQTADGALWEAEGSFARYVDSIAPYFDRVILSVPVFETPPASGSRLRATNVTFAAAVYFPGPRQFYPKLASIRSRLREWVDQCDVIHLRVPSPAAIFAFRIAESRRKPIFLLVVGDYEALLPHLGYRGIKKLLFSGYVAFEEWALRYMTRRALTFANGAALRAKHEREGARIHETKTTTLSLADFSTRLDTCNGPTIRLLCVSRIDPRKGLRSLPAVVRDLAAAGHDVTLDIVGPTIGLIGETERDAIAAASQGSGVADRVNLRGAVPLDQLLPLYREFDLFVLPTRPGEGIPRVLMEAMAAGLPIVTTDVAGISSLIRNGENGVLVPEGSTQGMVDALRSLITTPALRQRLIQAGYATARAHTLERQAASVMQIVATECGLPIRRPDAA